MLQPTEPAHNHAEFALAENQTEAEKEVLMNGVRPSWVQGDVKVRDFGSPGSFDIVLYDMAGVEQKRVPFVVRDTGRFGEQTDLPTIEDRYNIRVENAKNVSNINVFLE